MIFEILWYTPQQLLLLAVQMFRSGLVGFKLHGSLSHYYYHICEACPEKMSLSNDSFFLSTCNRKVVKIKCYSF
uniref:Uncharacterized protein n=1 Tax=Arundo donax TaxID=35708 RepID=A0A0A9GHQ9_ARUDO